MKLHNVEEIEKMFDHLINGTCCLLGDEQKTARERLDSLASYCRSTLDSCRGETTFSNSNNPETRSVEGSRSNHSAAKDELTTLLNKAYEYLNASAGDAFRRVMRTIRAKLELAREGL